MKNLSKREQVKEFKKFLKSRRVWSMFCREYTQQLFTSDSPLSRFFKLTHYSSWVGGSISWSDSVKGHQFWSDLEKEWKLKQRSYES